MPIWKGLFALAGECTATGRLPRTVPKSVCVGKTGKRRDVQLVRAPLSLSRSRS